MIFQNVYESSIAKNLSQEKKNSIFSKCRACWWPVTVRCCRSRMMTSPNGNIFRVTSHLCRNSSVPGEFPTQRPVTRSFDVFFDLHLNKRLSKQWWGWWFEMLSCPLWRHCNAPPKPEPLVLASVAGFYEQHWEFIFSLTHIPVDKMALFPIQHFQVHFPEWKVLYFASNFIKVCSLGSNQQYSSTGLDNGLAPIRWQAIIWTNADPLHWCIYTALGEIS